MTADVLILEADPGRRRQLADYCAGRGFRPRAVAEFAGFAAAWERDLRHLAGEAHETLARRIVTGVKTAVGVTPRVELFDPFSLPRMTSGQGKTACHRVDDRRPR
ncbi:MAG: hypothetical protein R6V57_13865 [Vicinamibacterales bacterium]